MHHIKQPRNTVGVGERTLGPGPVLVGVLNVTPDSFSDGGDFLDPEKAASRAAAILDEGAEIIDIGGESTRPGSDPVPREEEVRRVVPVIQKVLAERPDAIVSIDTYRAATAEAALAADAGCPLILMHMLGEPKTMQRDPRYDDVVREVRDFLAARAEHAIAASVDPENIILDPGIGFGKTLEHNLALLRYLDSLVELGFPVLFGASRKRFIGRITGVEDARDRVSGTVAANVLAYERGATFFRVHDVRPNREALAIAEAVHSSPR